MKVLYILNTTKMGGGNISFINMIKGMSSKGVEIYIVHPDKDIDSVFLKETSDIVKAFYYVHIRPQISLRIYENVLKKIKEQIKKSFGLKRIFLKKEIHELIKIIDDVRPDIVHTNVGVIHSGFFASQKAHIPHVWHLREYQEKDFNWDIYPSKKRFIDLLKKSNVITITNDIMSYFELDGYPYAKCIYNGCFSENDVILEMPKRNYFLCCSRISDEKGFDDVIRAFSEFQKNNKKYVLKILGFGEEAYITYLKQLAEDLKCSDQVEFLGFCEDVREYMDQAIALIVASRYEGFGRMTAEAAFRGCLVIGRDTGGTKEILEKIGGFSFEGGYKELAGKMKIVSEMDEHEYSLMAREAQIKAQELFSIEKSNEEVYMYYKDILGI